MLKFLFSLLLSATAYASTSITLTRSAVDQMAGLWETDSVTISALANTQYPQFSENWQFIFPRTNISADGDIHIDLAVDSAGTGENGNNTGASPIIAEVTNASTTQLNHLVSLTGAQAIPHGIFRFYTEHVSERHFELHPALQLQKWNGTEFVADSDYHRNVATVPDGNSHATSTLVNLLNGSQTASAAIASDNLRVNFVFPSPSVNYVQYDGVATSPVISDAVSDYFLFRPNLVPSATVRCRLVAKTASVNVANGLKANQSVTVNSLTRTDMAAVSARVARLSAGQSDTFARPVEFIVLGLLNVGPPPSPTPSPTPSPSLLNISTRLQVGTEDNVLIGGFIVQGNAPKKVILRGIGPSLATAGLKGFLVDPTLELHDADGSLIGRNDNWRTTQPGGVISGDQTAAIQASMLAPTDDAESAIMATLTPRAYTAIVRGAQNQTGIGLAEVYDLDQGTPAHLANISARGSVTTGDNVMFAGFIIGNQPTRIIVRGIGPSLAQAEIASPLNDPMLELRDGHGGLIAGNDNWRSDDEVNIVATSLAPSNDWEAAIVRNLAPGNYTAILGGKDKATGIALIEVYQLSP